MNNPTATVLTTTVQLPRNIVINVNPVPPLEVEDTTDSFDSLDTMSADDIERHMAFNSCCWQIMFALSAVVLLSFASVDMHTKIVNHAYYTDFIPAGFIIVVSPPLLIMMLYCYTWPLMKLMGCTCTCKYSCCQKNQSSVDQEMVKNDLEAPIDPSAINIESVNTNAN